jgi:mono/diheme cytochrome c family protein
VRSLSNSRATFAALTLAAAAGFAPQPAAAVPLFAQRYNLQCAACHSVLPELNAFGNAFRERGYRLDGAPKHGTTIVALREQVGYVKDPTDGTTRRVTPAGAILGAVEVGHVEAFVHENLGSGGGPASLFLGYLAYGDARSGVLYRAGLMELPLVHSPAQRNDTLTTYGYEGTLTGLNDLTLATPRWGLEAERNVGAGRIAATLAVANGSGSAYGGKPVATGRSESFAAPELGVYARFPVGNDVHVGVDALTGSRAIALSARPAFDDRYARLGTSLEAHLGRLELLAEQWWGRDFNADGAGGRLDSDGGFVRLRWRLGSHAYLGIREDGAAAPAATRALLWYVESHVTPHARVLIQQRRPIPGGPASLEGALTIGVPWPRGK